MATYKRGILGRFTGKVGTVVGTTWRGISVMRAVPSEVRNPRTPKQQAQRERFQLIAKLIRQARPFIQAGFEIRSSDRFTAANAMMSYNIRFGITGDFPAQVLHWPNIRFAMGSLQGPAHSGSSVTLDTENGQAVFSWIDNSGQNNALAGDLAMVLLYHTATDQALFDVSAATRESGTAMLQLPEAFTEDPSGVHAWLAFRRSDDADERISSDSLYLGKLAVSGSPANGEDESNSDGDGDADGNGAPSSGNGNDQDDGSGS
ncbi:hypothetical protein CYPRO_2470 [Cyclonatronum proteinivorum]|uniref:Uncharacterized protein n=1 Tax=Cyclonatronum proteinivorum TaxID=1457365 RepID=A0A345UML0_9BACT|nr:DUF6266 family protein [Cyclonatronum proteinivorum]AXJ01712.1 hypothetical protein CYPRO_2470 [Cyclonatronum proteinivorum]